MIIHDLFFYFFSFIAIIASLMVTLSKNTVHSVFFLILDFITIACLFIMIGAEFLGMIMLIVYVGAVAVLFLFVVMMLNVNLPVFKKGFKEYLPFGGLISSIIFIELLLVFSEIDYINNFKISNKLTLDTEISNTESLGSIIYTDYIHIFQLSGMILLVAMVGAIVSTHTKRDSIKRQNVFSQISREKKSSISLVDVEKNRGVKIDD